MPGYHAIIGNPWDRTFRALSLPAKVVAFHLQTSLMTRSEGLFLMSTGHIAADTGLPERDVTAALDELNGAGLVDYDADAELILDRRAAKACRLKIGTATVKDANGNIVRDEDGKPRTLPQPDKRIKSAVAYFERLPASPLKEVFRQLVADNAPALAQALPPPTEAPSMPLTKPLRRGEDGQGQGRGYEDVQGDDRCEVCGDLPCVCSPAVRMRLQTEQMRRKYKAQTGQRLGAAS